MKFKNSIIIIAASLCMLAAVSAKASADEPQKPEYLILAPVGTEAPDFEVELMDGANVKLSDYRGRIVLLNFWATWCPYCIKELEMVQSHLLSVFDQEQVVVLAVSRGEKRDTVRKYVDKAGYTFLVGLDPDEEIFKMYANQAIPRTFIIDKTGVVAHAEIGYDEELYDGMVEKLLELVRNE